MSDTQIEALAAKLVAARRSGRPLALETIDPTLIPPDLAAAYAVQHVTRLQASDPVAGWKIGATSAPIMEKFGVTEPLYGPIYAADLFESPASIPSSRFPIRAIETEFAFRLGADLVARTAPWSRDELAEAVAAVVPVFEIICPRYDRLPFDNVNLAVADSVLNGGLMTGPPIMNWQHLDLGARPVRLIVDGREVAAGSGADAYGDPWNVLEWLANKLGAAGVDLEAGQLVSTGTCTGVVTLEPGQTAIGDFGDLGRIELTFR